MALDVILETLPDIVVGLLLAAHAVEDQPLHCLGLYRREEYMQAHSMLTSSTCDSTGQDYYSSQTLTAKYKDSHKHC